VKNVVNHLGKKYGKLTVLYQWVGDKYRLYAYCRCDCGVEKKVRISHMVQGATLSCGCVSIQRMKNLNLTHGHSGTLQHHSWKGMKRRCMNPKNPGYKDYGERGITVCDRWLRSYDNFIADMGLPPSPKHSIDRINNSGNYEPSNCRWATAKQQSNNRRPRKTKTA
jgi:hypothetical protein